MDAAWGGEGEMKNSKLETISELLSGMTLKEWAEIKKAVEKMYSTASENIKLADAETVRETLRHQMNMPYVQNGNIKFGVCPKCGGRYTVGMGYYIEPNFHNEPVYQCLDCGHSET